MMQVETLYFTQNKWSFEEEIITNKNDVNLVLAFGDTDEFASSIHYTSLRELYPNADIVGASSAGNILGSEMSEHSIVATAVSFSSSKVMVSIVDFEEGDDLAEISKNLVSSLHSDGLRNIFIISDGLNMNGSIMAKSVNEAKPNILITGGLAGDGVRFEKTLIMANAPAKEKRIVALGFYGENLHVSSGCVSGWNEFGAQRTVTKSVANVVYEIDNEPALALYKKYLAEKAKELPSSGLLFPLSIKTDENDTGIIRTLLGIDEEAQSLTFAGDVPQGCLAKLMKSSINGLIDGSEQAAKKILKSNTKSALGLVVSCVGRKLVMKQLADEELEVIAETIGDNISLVGFYSYGELAPFSDDLLSCRLHNQTMTLTAIYED